MLTRVLVIGAFLLAGVLIYVIVRAIMRRASRLDSRPTPPVDIVDRPEANPTARPKYESPDERIARLEDELRRLGDEDDDEPRPGRP
jgi:hypothetical protein